MKISFAKWGPFCPGQHELKDIMFYYLLDVQSNKLELIAHNLLWLSKFFKIWVKTVVSFVGTNQFTYVKKASWLIYPFSLEYMWL